MSLIGSKEVARLVHLDKFGFIGTFIGWLFLKVTRISGVNRVYNKSSHLKGVEFLDGMLDGFKIK